MKSSFVPKHENCFCIDCRDPADRDRLGTLSRNRDGDKVLELDSDESVPLGIHCAPGQWRDDSSFGGSSSRGGRSSSSYGGAGAGSGRQGQGRGYGYAQIRQSAMRSYTRDSNGDSIEEYGGAGTPDVYVHLNPNDPSHRNLRDDEYAYYRR
ncbi:hypothetical protein BZA77DRAFT_318538 [Pyronema omphalodes]|nr:hypothetical protein BZA77DRAFT_318538 [Pyronema omphalodes]